MITKAVKDILDERQKQIKKHGFDENHDNENSYFDMANYAAMYILQTTQELDGNLFEQLHPHEWDVRWWKPETQRQNLVKAAALIIAELEMWDREDVSDGHLSSINSDFLDDLRQKNSERQEEWPSDINVDELFKANELAGEVGEVCGAVKKLYRNKFNILGNTQSYPELRENLEDEIGDVMICLDLLAKYYDIDIAEVTKSKFNKSSIKNGLTTKF